MFHGEVGNRIIPTQFSTLVIVNCSTAPIQELKETEIKPTNPIRCVGRMRNARTVLSRL